MLVSAHLVWFGCVVTAAILKFSAAKKIGSRGCSGKMANFGTSLLGPENQGYVSYDVCDDGP